MTQIGVLNTLGPSTEAVTPPGNNCQGIAPEKISEASHVKYQHLSIYLSICLSIYLSGERNHALLHVASVYTLVYLSPLSLYIVCMPAV